MPRRLSLPCPGLSHGLTRALSFPLPRGRQQHLLRGSVLGVPGTGRTASLGTGQRHNPGLASLGPSGRLPSRLSLMSDWSPIWNWKVGEGRAHGGAEPVANSLLLVAANLGLLSRPQITSQHLSDGRVQTAFQLERSNKLLFSLSSRTFLLP